MCPVSSFSCMIIDAADIGDRLRLYRPAPSGDDKQEGRGWASAYGGNVVADALKHQAILRPVP